MEPFKVSPSLQEIAEHYPPASKLRDVAVSGGEGSRIAIARLWLSEGIPYAFKECPGVYESVRSWLGSRLAVDPKEIHLTGSARLGQSLSPKKLGKPFDASSDFDLFVVRQELFDKMQQDFNSWSYDFERGIVSPSNDLENSFWKDNLQRGPKLMLRGFLDSKMVPNRKAYPTITNISQSMWLLKKKLDITPAAPKIRSASIRCYKTWADYVRQVTLSLS